MNEEEAREIIDNMSEQELNDFIFFSLQEVEKENQRLKAELEKKDKIIDEMIDFIDEIDGCLCFDFVSRNCIDKNCKECIKQYFERKVENGN